MADKKVTKRNQGDLDLLQSMIFEWSARGAPEKGAAIARAIELEIEVPSDAIIKSMVSKENASFELSGTIPPPRAGKGSGTEEWRDYAFANLDIDEEVLNNMSKADVIALLEDAGVIDSPDTDKNTDVDTDMNIEED